jgi:uncharacterized protein YukE
MAPGASVINVEVSALYALAGQIRTARSALEDDAGAFGRSGNGIEHPVLQREVDHFDERWSDKRAKIREGLTACADAMDTAADSFQEADRALKACLDQPAGDGR